MRQIKSKDLVEKKQRRNGLFIGLILILVMMSSVLGFAFFSGGGSSSNQKKTYDKIRFIKNENNMWQAQVNNQIIVTSYTPYETEDISVDFNIEFSNFYGKPLYFVSDNQQAKAELVYNIVNNDYALRAQGACLEGEPCEYETLPVKDCTNNMIIFKELGINEDIKIYKQDNCVFIEAPYDKQVLASNKLIFKLFGIQ